MTGIPSRITLTRELLILILRAVLASEEEVGFSATSRVAAGKMEGGVGLGYVDMLG